MSRCILKSSLSAAVIAALIQGCSANHSSAGHSDSPASYRSETVWRRPPSGCPANTFQSEDLCAACNPWDPQSCEPRCAAGDGDSCSLIGFSSESNANFTHAAKLYERACDLGSGKGCEGLARLLMRGNGLQKDEKRSADLLERMCLAKRPRACTAFAEALLAGRGRAQDQDTGMRLLEDSCAGLEPEACQLLGDPRVREDVDTAVAAARERMAACRPGKEGESCRLGRESER
jgi:TPR repeat protein